MIGGVSSCVVKGHENDTTTLYLQLIIILAKKYLMRFTLLIACVFLANTMSAQINLNKLKSAAIKAQEVISPTSLSRGEVARGLKEALIVGATNSAISASKKGGFTNNSLIRIPFPKDAENLKKTLVKVGMRSQVDKFEYVLNEAAEDASNFAKDIFINAIESMEIQDAISILKGDNNAATTYLKTQTSKELYAAFIPVVETSIAKVKLTKYWSILVERYNSIPLTEQVHTDLEDYVTNYAIEGLFILIAKEEKNIRNNPKARVSEILQKVFK